MFLKPVVNNGKNLPISTGEFSPDFWTFNSMVSSLLFLKKYKYLQVHWANKLTKLVLRWKSESSNAYFDQKQWPVSLQNFPEKNVLWGLQVEINWGQILLFTRNIQNRSFFTYPCYSTNSDVCLKNNKSPHQATFHRWVPTSPNPSDS